MRTRNATTVPLAEIIRDVQSGFASGRSDPNGVVQVRMNNVDTEGRLIWTQIRRIPASEREIERTRLEPGDILFNNTNSPDLVGKSALFEGYGEPVVFSNHFTRIRVNSNRIEPRFLARWLVKAWEQRVFEGLCTRWVNQALVRKEDLISLEIPLFPLEQQKRVAAVLDKADAIRRKRQQALQLADEFLRSVFLDVFGDPVTNPKKWDEVPLSEASEIRSGVAKGRIFNGKQTVTVPYMRVANVQDGRIDLTEVKQIEVLPEDVERYLLKRGDILLTEGGDPDKLGRGAVWEDQIRPCIHQNHIFSVRVTRSRLAPEFLSALVASKRGKAYFLKASKQTTGIATINKTQLSQFPIFVPHWGIQERYVAVLKRTQQATRTQTELAKQSQRLFDSLTQRAFRGDL